MTFKITPKTKRKTSALSLRLTEDLRVFVSKMAKEQGVSMNKVACDCIAFAMKHQAS